MVSVSVSRAKSRVQLDIEITPLGTEINADPIRAYHPEQHFLAHVIVALRMRVRESRLLQEGLL